MLLVFTLICFYVQGEPKGFGSLETLGDIFSKTFSSDLGS